MLKINPAQLAKLEGQYPGISATVQYFEAMNLRQCPACHSADTASVQVGIIGMTISLCTATTKFKLIPNCPKPGNFFCNACANYFN